MTTAPVVDALLADLAAAGLEVVARGDRIRYRPIAAMTPGLLGRVRQSKPALLKALSSPPPAPAAPAPGRVIADCPALSPVGQWVAPVPQCHCCGHSRWWRFP